MKIAIVGGGIAGLGAAWSLSTSHDVTLYESGPVLGGHARTVKIEKGQAYAEVDIGFMFFNEATYPNLTSMLHTLGVKSKQISSGLDITVQYGPDLWKSGKRTSLWQRVNREASRFECELETIVENSDEYSEISINDYLDDNDYSEDFKLKVIEPLLSVLFSARMELTDTPIVIFAIYFQPTSVLSFTKPTSWLKVENGSADYIKRISAACSATFRLNSPVSSIFRTGRSVLLTEEDGKVNQYDHVIIATDAESALRILTDPDTNELNLLKQINYESTWAVLHTDANVMPGNRTMWSVYNYIRFMNMDKLGAVVIHYYLNAIQEGLDTDIFLSINPTPGMITPSLIVDEISWINLRWNYLQAQLSSQFHEIQGKRRTWFCGEHTTPILGHEASFVTGLAIGKRLGGEYPFELNKRAKKTFDTIAKAHMKVL